MSSRPENYERLTRDQVGILENHFDKGMKSTKCSQLIEKAAEETLLPVEKIKKWIGNKVASVKKRQMQQLGTGEPPPCTPPKVPKAPPAIRGLSGYNLFCSDFFKSDEVKEFSMAEKNKMASINWNNLPKPTQDEWVKKASTIKENPHNLDDDTKQKLIDQHIKFVAKELNYLERLGCDSSCLVVNERKEIFVLGSSQGKDFLHNESSLVCKFQSAFDIDQKSQEYTHEHVKLLFNAKYSEAKGVTGARVPYLSRGFHVEGLPENIRLKKPSHYGSIEIKKIMAKKDDIRFVIEPKEHEEISSVGKDRQELLETVFGRKNFSGTKKISQDDIQEVTKETFASISVIQELICSCGNLFSNDALAELRRKCDEFATDAQEVILPVYCSDEKDNFWLLYYTDSVRNLQQITEKDKLTGYWLDHESTTTYKLLGEKVTLIGENIIKDNGRFFFEVYKFEEKSQMFVLNKSFEKKIINVLSEQGYI